LRANDRVFEEWAQNGLLVVSVLIVRNDGAGTGLCATVTVHFCAVPGAGSEIAPFGDLAVDWALAHCTRFLVNQLLSGARFALELAIFPDHTRSGANTIAA
jgi:hypothetical protein